MTWRQTRRINTCAARRPLSVGWLVGCWLDASNNQSDNDFFHSSADLALALAAAAQITQSSDRSVIAAPRSPPIGNNTHLIPAARFTTRLSRATLIETDFRHKMKLCFPVFRRLLPQPQPQLHEQQGERRRRRRRRRQRHETAPRQPRGHRPRGRRRRRGWQQALLEQSLDAGGPQGQRQWRRLAGDNDDEAEARILGGAVQGETRASQGRYLFFVTVKMEDANVIIVHVRKYEN